MSVKDLINKAYEKDASGFEEMFNELMAVRMEASISDKFDAMFEAKSEDDMEDDEEDDEDEEDELDEEAEELDELSDKTLASYAGKASSDFERRKKNLGAQGQLRAAQKRKQGVGRAVDKMHDRRFGK